MAFQEIYCSTQQKRLIEKREEKTGEQIRRIQVLTHKLYEKWKAFNPNDKRIEPMLQQ